MPPEKIGVRQQNALAPDQTAQSDLPGAATRFFIPTFLQNCKPYLQLIEYKDRKSYR